MIKKRFKIAISALIFSLLLTTPSAFAWWDMGHKVIARIAYDNLTPEARVNIAKRMGCNPEFLADFLTNISTWPDEIRNARRETAPWHYVNKPYFVGVSPVEIEIKRDNLVSKVRDFISILKETRNETGSDPQDSLKYLVHFVGDMHCPYHNISLYTDHSFKDSSHDRGGTLFRCNPRGSLHFYWDAVPSTILKEKYSYNLDKFARDICRKYPRSSLEKELKEKDVDKWSDDAHMTARKGYFINCLDDTKGYLENGQELPGEYRERSEEICMKQLALGGYRLADILNTIFGK